LMVLRAKSVPGSYLRYVVTTMLVAVMYAFMLTHTLYCGLQRYVTESSAERGVYACLAVLSNYIWGDVLYKVLKDGDDNWFTDYWKKLRRLLRNIRMSIRFKSRFEH
jgi:hypothetical protein